MKVFVGLGNPGLEYQYNRHNAGFLAIDFLLKKFIADNQRLKLDKKHQVEWLKVGEDYFIKPHNFMNNSGEGVRSFLDYYSLLDDLKNLPQKLDWLYIFHDDLDLPLGQYKTQFGTGPKIHNGLLSLYEQLGTKDFWHVRIGVDARGGDRSISGSDYVLSNFRPLEQEVLTDVLKKISQEFS